MTQIAACPRPSHSPAAGLALRALARAWTPMADLCLEVHQTSGQPTSQGQADKGEQGIWGPVGGTQLEESGGGYQMTGKAPWKHRTPPLCNHPDTTHSYAVLSLMIRKPLCEVGSVISHTLQMRKLRFRELRLLA